MTTYTLRWDAELETKRYLAILKVNKCQQMAHWHFHCWRCRAAEGGAVQQKEVPCSRTDSSTGLCGSVPVWSLQQLTTGVIAVSQSKELRRKNGSKE